LNQPNNAPPLPSTPKLLCFIGKYRIQAEILQGQRAEYGKQIIATLSQQLTQTYGKGWSDHQLRYCVLIAEVFPDRDILYTLSAKCRRIPYRINTQRTTSSKTPTSDHLSTSVITKIRTELIYFKEIARYKNLAISQIAAQFKKSVRINLEKTKLCFKSPALQDF
jgi:hypothetical protein